MNLKKPTQLFGIYPGDGGGGGGVFRLIKSVDDKCMLLKTEI